MEGVNIELLLTWYQQCAGEQVPRTLAGKLSTRPTYLDIGGLAVFCFGICGH